MARHLSQLLFVLPLPLGSGLNDSAVRQGLIVPAGQARLCTPTASLCKRMCSPPHECSCRWQDGPALAKALDAAYGARLPAAWRDAIVQQVGHTAMTQLGSW